MRHLLTFVTTNIIIVLILLILDQVFTLTRYIDVTFLAALVYLLLGLLVFVVKGGFFDTLASSFRKVMPKKVVGDTEPLRAPSETLNVPYKGLLIQAGLFALVSLVSLFFYYNT
ncbi:DUF3899 domain-containing protein [Bacillus fonticola]|uniref:DUF3899 domain-containing protein n=1 Tax=Bacillus fonticola TaxID=2728853 RepID=UPI00147319E2|nr:DUF3899 domain-containing protein [Bacillus fonticola]